MMGTRVSGYDLDEGLVAEPPVGTPIRIYDEDTGELLNTGTYEYVYGSYVFYRRDGQLWSTRGYHLIEWDGGTGDEHC